jgi:hypothetical protein
MSFAIPPPDAAEVTLAHLLLLPPPPEVSGGLDEQPAASSARAASAASAYRCGDLTRLPPLAPPGDEPPVLTLHEAARHGKSARTAPGFAAPGQDRTGFAAPGQDRTGVRGAGPGQPRGVTFRLGFHIYNLYSYMVLMYGPGIG